MKCLSSGLGSFSTKLYYILITLTQCSSGRTLQQCLQQRRRNASLQQLYNIGNSVGMGVVGRVFTPTRLSLEVYSKYHKSLATHH